MKYKIDPELRGIAMRIPYNKLMIRLASIYLPIALRLTALPDAVRGRSIYIAGHKGLRFKTDIFEPKTADGTLPCLIYAHGGAFTYAASAYHKKLACMYAAGGGCRVFFPDYHLAPKYKFPAAYDDILALYRYIIDNADELHVDASRIALAGDSAGGCLAALVCCIVNTLENRYIPIFKLGGYAARFKRGRIPLLNCVNYNYRREGLPPPRAQLLAYPLTDCNMDTESMRRYTDTPLWNAKSSRKMWAYYCGGNEDDMRAASPMHCPPPDAVPEAYIETAEFDCLHDEGVLYAGKLRAAGGRVTLNETAGTVHGYDCAINAAISISNIQKRIDFLLDVFKKRS